MSLSVDNLYRQMNEGSSSFEALHEAFDEGYFDNTAGRDFMESVRILVIDELAQEAIRLRDIVTKAKQDALRGRNR